MPGSHFAHAYNESESMHFAHARKHIFAWHGPNGKCMHKRLLISHLRCSYKRMTAGYDAFNDCNGITLHACIKCILLSLIGSP